jgi:hypothetical protein
MKHHCEEQLPLPSLGYGGAINRCIEDDFGRFWAENEEYSSQVRFCPFCGLKAPRQPDEKREGAES